MKTDVRLAESPERGADTELETRIRAEYAEMPGLKLTVPQASRLFNVERSRCERILGSLVSHGDLANRGGSFLSARNEGGSLPADAGRH